MSSTKVKYRKKLPWLKKIPDGIYENLDSSEWLYPNGQILKIIIKMQKKISGYVMPYKKGMFNLNIKPHQHLCANIEAKKLSHKQKKILQTCEKNLEPFNIALSIYKKPVKMINPTKSELYKYYIENKIK